MELDIPGHSGTAEIAGYNEWGREWQDVENGDPEPRIEHGGENIEMVTYHYVNDHGDDVYFTIHGPFTDDYPIEEAIADSLNRYGIA